MSYRRRRSHRPGTRRIAAALAAVLLLGAQHRPDVSAGARHHGGEPIQLEYACDNRFVVSSTYLRPRTLTFTVADADEGGSVRLDAAPHEDPYFSEALTRARGAVKLFLDGRPVAARENDGVPCPPAATAALAAPAAPTNA